MRRTLLLVALVALGAILVVVVRPPDRREGLAGVRGVPVFGGGSRRVTAVEARWDGHAFAARRERDGWTVDGARADPATADALADLAKTLVRLRAVDAFVPSEAGGFGLDAPRLTIVLHRGRRRRTLAVGAMNAAGSAFYARRDGDRRVLQVGSGLLSALERVLYNRDRQRPEIG